MRTRAQTVRLGIFVASALGFLLLLLIVLSGTALLQRRDDYTIVFSETVSGLEVGAAVKLLGVRVGRIESYRVQAKDGTDKVEVKVSLEHGTPIRTNAKASLSGSGLTGLMFVEITGGTSEAPLLEPGSEIPAGTSLLTTLSGKAETIAIKVEEVLNRVLVLTEAQNLANVTETIDNVKVATRELKAILEQFQGVMPQLTAAVQEIQPTLADVRTAAKAVNVAGTSMNANGALEAAIQEIKPTLKAAQDLLGGDHAAQLSDDVRAAIKSFTETMNNLSIVIGSSGADFREIASSMRDAAEHLEEFARSIRENPSLLLRTPKED